MPLRPFRRRHTQVQREEEGLWWVLLQMLALMGMMLRVDPRFLIMLDAGGGVSLYE